jgi:tetratricopeptide (TPR) repeat protein
MSQENINNETNYDDNFYDQSNYYGCKNCGSSIVEEGYKFNLCEDCRNKLSKRPVPKKIKIVFFIVIGLVIYSLMRFPTTMKGAIAYEKGNQAEEQKKYFTALEEYQKASEQYTSSGDIISKIIIAEYYNGNYSKVIDLLIALEGTTIDSEELYNQLDKISIELQDIYVPGDELNNLLDSIETDTDSVKIQKLTEYINAHPNNTMSAYILFDLLCGQGDYEQAKNYMSKVLGRHPDNQYALICMASIENKLENYDSAISYCNHILDINIESADAYSSLAKIELARLDNEKALEYIQKAYSIDSDDLFIMEGLVEIYHYNDMIEERDAMIDIIKQRDDVSEEDIEYIENLTQELN